MESSEVGMLRVDRRALLAFYDDPEPGEKGMTATAVNAVAGEEFGLALLLRYLSESGRKPRFLPGPCSAGKFKGHRLDAWVETPGCLYQVEIKNWSAHSFSGSALPVDANEAVAREHRKRIWGEYWTGSTFRDDVAAKVLERMNPPAIGVAVEPLIAFWVPLHPNGAAESFFSFPLHGLPFERVNVFSMSTYLRGVAEDFIELPLPKTKTRLAVLERIFAAG